MSVLSVFREGADTAQEKSAREAIRSHPHGTNTDPDWGPRGTPHSLCFSQQQTQPKRNRSESSVSISFRGLDLLIF
jgi:hypothetical protein